MRDLPESGIGPNVLDHAFEIRFCFAGEGARGVWIWDADFGLALKTFGYLRDRLFLIGCILYAVNRWIIKPHLHVAFFQNWFNDSLLIPCALPPLLLAHRWLGLRNHHAPPSGLKISAP